MKKNKEAIASLPKEQLNAMKQLCPSFFWVPNRAQARPFLHWMGRPYPRVHIITFGNRTGKTEWLGQFLTGASKGKDKGPNGKDICYVNPDYYSPFFDDLEKKRKKGTLTIWWVCEADLMKKNGADYKIIKSHLPDAQFKGRTNNGVYREIHVPVKDENGKFYNLVISVKTHDQDSISFAGDNVDLIMCDEPPPQKHWSEISGRMVTLKGEMGGRIVIGGTPLKMGSFLLDIIEEAADEGDDNRVVHDKGSIWENCAGDEVPDDIAEKYNIPKDPKTGHYMTNGHLTREGIENAIKNWEKSGDPDELAARVDGEFTHAQGRIYKFFNKNIHVIKPYETPESYPVIMIVDPHDSRPDAAGWFVATPGERLICIAEYPEQPFENYTTRHQDITRTCEAWDIIENNLNLKPRIFKRVGDPNYMNDPDPHTLKRKHELYAEHGYNFSLDVNDSLEYGHEKVRRLLYYDKLKIERFPEDPMYLPHLLFFDTCRNHIKFIRNYGTKIQKDPSKDYNETPEKKWKHYPDIVRYLAVTFSSFEEIKASMSKNRGDEWKAIQNARNPFGQQNERFFIGNTLVR